MASQCTTAFGLKRSKLGGAFVAGGEMLASEVDVEQFENGIAGLADAGVVHEIRFAQGAQSRLERGASHLHACILAFREIRAGLHVDVDPVLEQPSLDGL